MGRLVPDIAELEGERLERLCAILARHTGTADKVFFGLSTIHGGVTSGYPEAKQLIWPIREFVVLVGPLAEVDQVGYPGSEYGPKTMYLVREGDPPPPEIDPSERYWHQAPNLIWPDDRAWFVQSEYDFDSTLLGGSAALVAELLDDDLEVLEVETTTLLTAFSDELNPLPEEPATPSEE